MNTTRAVVLAPELPLPESSVESLQAHLAGLWEKSDTAAGLHHACVVRWVGINCGTKLDSFFVHDAKTTSHGPRPRPST
jgi:hypothetical protein